MDSQKKSAESLEIRHQKEAEFHDHKYSSSDSSPKHYDVNPTFRIFQRMLQMIGDVSGKRILEYGCGNGWMTAELAALGAYVDSFDISPQAVESTKALLEKHGLAERCNVRKMGAEELDYEDGRFDIVFGFAILHHLDLDKALKELYRVIKPGGYAIFAEPLEGNPGLKIYRRLTPNYRTVDEQPIVISDFRSRTRQFSGFQHEEFYLISLLSFALIYIPGGKFLFDLVLKPLLFVDKLLFRVFPPIGNWAWYSIFRLRK